MADELWHMCYIYILRAPATPAVPLPPFILRQEDISKYLDATDPVAGAAASEAAAAAIKVRGPAFCFLRFLLISLLSFVGLVPCARDGRRSVGGRVDGARLPHRVIQQYFDCVKSMCCYCALGWNSTDKNVYIGATAVEESPSTFFLFLFPPTPPGRGLRECRSRRS